MDFKHIVHKVLTRRVSHGFESPWGHWFLALLAIILVRSAVTESGTESNNIGTQTALHQCVSLEGKLGSYCNVC